MSSDQETLVQKVSGMPVRSVVVRVLGGPDQSKTHRADSDVLTIGSAPGNDLVLSDPAVSRYHAELRRLDSGIHLCDLGSTNGTFIGATRIERGTIVPGTELRMGDSTLAITEGEEVQAELWDSDAFHGIRGRSPTMRRLIARVEKAAGSNVSCLLLGETGTGKELIAQAIHDASPRRNGPFEVVDCGVLMPTLIASELFGHERGAFTGAQQQHIGAFERADGGTIFLDEVGELPAQLQSALLGVLERRTLRRVGGSKPISVDVRLIAATHRDLRSEVNAGAFRADLYYRLAVVLLEVPPLRERKEDIEVLAEHFLGEAGHDGAVTDVLSSKVLRSLEEYHWPGNVRELRNFVESALAMGEIPDLAHAPDPSTGSEPVSFLSSSESRLFSSVFKDARAAVLSDFERAYLSRLMDRCDGNISKAAREAKLNRAYLQELLRKHGMR